MARKAVHRMNFGFNSNVRVGDAMYHVQTEDRGPSHPYLDTVVYETGRVVYKRSTSYEKFANAVSKDQDLAEQLHERLSQQHREVIAQLEAGTIELRGQGKPNLETPVTEPADGLEVRLTNSGAWYAAGTATLEIELRRKNSKQTLADAEVEAFLEHEKERAYCAITQTDSAGKATLKFPMPSTASEGTSLVIRATDGSLYGELRFRLRAKDHGRIPAPVSK
jgi:hypothetical protein